MELVLLIDFAFFHVVNKQHFIDFVVEKSLELKKYIFNAKREKTKQFL